MRNFANYDVDIHGKSSGVLKTICKKCLPTRKNKRDRSLRVNVDTGHCHCYHCGADFYVPDDVEELLSHDLDTGADGKRRKLFTYLHHSAHSTQQPPVSRKFIPFPGSYQ